MTCLVMLVVEHASARSWCRRRTAPRCRPLPRRSRSHRPCRETSLLLVVILPGLTVSSGRRAGLGDRDVHRAVGARTRAVGHLVGEDLAAREVLGRRVGQLLPASEPSAEATVARVTAGSLAASVTWTLVPAGVVAARLEATGARLRPEKVYFVRPTVMALMTPSPTAPEPSDQPARRILAFGNAARHSVRVPWIVRTAAARVRRGAVLDELLGAARRPHQSLP